MENKYNSVVENVLEFNKSLRVPVMLSHDEIDRITVNRLIRIRNANINRNEDMAYIDQTIKFFLTEDEFEKYVVNNQEIEG